MPNSVPDLPRVERSEKVRWETTKTAHRQREKRLEKAPLRHCSGRSGPEIGLQAAFWLFLLTTRPGYRDELRGWIDAPAVNLYVGGSYVFRAVCSKGYWIATRRECSPKRS